jgi:FMN phosphatase YigB (HAD superfamily)
MKLLLFDVYHTLLSITSCPWNEGNYQKCVESFLPGSTIPEWSRVSSQLEKAIQREHTRAKQIQRAEVQWHRLLLESFPAASRLSQQKLHGFAGALMSLQRTAGLMSGADETLREAQKAGCKLGICSNAQGYTLAELDQALAPHGISRALFDPFFVFWSFEHGYAKPDPYVFHLLRERAAGSGIRAEEILMIGDRLDNDVHPALHAGMNAWHFSSIPEHTLGGTHQDLVNFLKPGKR